MEFEKGREKTGGREKGTPNKKTQQWEIFSEWFLFQGMDRLALEIEKLEGKEFVYVMKDLLEYFKPKLSRSRKEDYLVEKPIPIMQIKWEDNEDS